MSVTPNYVLRVELVLSNDKPKLVLNDESYEVYPIEMNGMLALGYALADWEYSLNAAMLELKGKHAAVALGRVPTSLTGVVTSFIPLESIPIPPRWKPSDTTYYHPRHDKMIAVGHDAAGAGIWCQLKLYVESLPSPFAGPRPLA